MSYGSRFSPSAGNLVCQYLYQLQTCLYVFLSRKNLRVVSELLWITYMILKLHTCIDYMNMQKYIYIWGGGIVVKELHYKPAGCGFDSRWCHWNFSVT